MVKIGNEGMLRLAYHKYQINILPLNMTSWPLAEEKMHSSGGRTVNFNIKITNLFESR